MHSLPQVLIVIDAATYARLTDSVAAVCAAGQSDLGAWGIASAGDDAAVDSADSKSKPKPNPKPTISAASVAVALRDLEADVFAVIRSFATAAGLAAVLQNNGTAAIAHADSASLSSSSSVATAHHSPAASADAAHALESDRAGTDPDHGSDSPEHQASSAASQPPPHVSVLARLLNIVAGNASAALRDVHVRFEDRLSAPEQPYALNVHVQSLTTGPRDRSFSPFRVVQYRACMADGLFVGLGGLPPAPASTSGTGLRDVDSAAAAPLQPSMTHARRGSVSAGQHHQQATRQRSASFISDGPPPFSPSSSAAASAAATAASSSAASAALLPTTATSFTSSPRQARPPLAAWSIAPALSPLAPVLRLHHLSVEICALMAPRALLLMSDSGASDDAQPFDAFSGALDQRAQYHAAANSVESLRAVEKQPNVRINVKLEEIHVTFSEVCAAGRAAVTRCILFYALTHVYGLMLITFSFTCCVHDMQTDAKRIPARLPSALYHLGAGGLVRPLAAAVDL